MQIRHTISAFSFLDQHNKLVTEKDIEGKVHVGSFIFTSCGVICPQIVKNLTTVKNAFKSNEAVVILSFSVTPWIDSVPRLRNYADNKHINSPDWHLLTGKKSDIYKLARQSYFAEEDMGFNKDSTEFLHTEHLILVDRKKRIRGIYNGTLELEAEQLIRDIKTLMNE
jgi:protein SCO1/2